MLHRSVNSHVCKNIYCEVLNKINNTYLLSYYSKTCLKRSARDGKFSLIVSVIRYKR